MKLLNFYMKRGISGGFHRHPGLEPLIQKNGSRASEMLVIVKIGTKYRRDLQGILFLDQGLKA